MSILPRIESWSNILKNFVIIGGVAIAVFFMGVSIYANVTEDRPGDADLPKPPALSKAAWEVTIVNTGNTLYTNSYVHPTDAVYILHGYYEIREGKYRLHKNDLKLDELYFGDIIVKKR